MIRAHYLSSASSAAKGCGIVFHPSQKVVEVNLKAKMLFTCVLSGILVVQPVFASNKPVTMDVFQDVLSQVETEYYKPVSRDALLQASLKGMLSSLDPYSEYFTASEYKSFTDSIEGAFVGIGIIVNEDPKYIKVGQVYPGSPALYAGVQKDDLITSVNGQDVSAYVYEERIDRLLGAENTSVTLGILRGSERLTKTITRKRIEVNPVESKMLPNDIGYIRIYEFTTSSSKYFEDALRVFQDQKIKGLVVDLRDNPGGDIEAVLKIGEWFVPKGTALITVKYRTGGSTYASERTPLNLPIVVLVNENSASGSEMLAGIIKDNKTGTLVGTKTYGKGVAQATYSMKDGNSGGFKLTVAEFFTTAMVKIQGVGVKPDITVLQPTAIPEKDMNNLAVIESDSAVKLGFSGLNVMAVEQSLVLMGYKVATDGVYDPATYDILKQMGVDVDGSLTKAEAQKVQSLLKQASQKAREDVQLNKAMEILPKK